QGGVQMLPIRKWFRRSSRAAGPAAPGGPARPRLEHLEDRLTPSAGAREQYALELINHLRTNPAGELSRLVFSADPDVNAALAYDWGPDAGGLMVGGMQPALEHRANLLDPHFQEVGIGVGDAPPGKLTGPLLVTEDFGYRSWAGPAVVGAVFADVRHDGSYQM